MAEEGGQGFTQGRGGNEGMSGAPMWQVRQKMADHMRQRESLVQALIAEHEERTATAEAPNVLVDAAVLAPAAADAKAKPHVRHVIVKDLNRVAQLKKIEFPRTDLFQNKAPIGLYAVFDGQANSSGAPPGPAAADYCARNLHTKVMDNLQMLRQGSANEPYVKAALIKSFHDLDAECLEQEPQVQDGCGAAVALLVGQHIFVATLGRCGAVLAEAQQGEKPRPMALSGQAKAVSGSLGAPAKKSAAGASTGCTPEVHCVKMADSDSHPFLLLASSTLAAVLNPVQLVDAVADFQMQPRAACGDILASVAESSKSTMPSQQFVLAQVCFLPDKEKSKAPDKKADQPSAKKAKLGSKGTLSSMRLRHILLRTQDAAASKQPASAAVKAKPARWRQEAEVTLRGILKDMKQNLKDAPKAPKTANDLVLYQGKRFNELCREHSDCQTAKKGGAMCGDLGWMSLEDLTHMGGNLREKCDPLKPGQWSDLCSSDQGVHLVQRVA